MTTKEKEPLEVNQKCIDLTNKKVNKSDYKLNNDNNYYSKDVLNDNMKFEKRNSQYTK